MIRAVLEEHSSPIPVAEAMGTTGVTFELNCREAAVTVKKDNRLEHEKVLGLVVYYPRSCTFQRCCKRDLSPGQGSVIGSVADGHKCCENAIDDKREGKKR